MRLRRGARPSPRRGGEQGGLPERSCAARLHEHLSSAPPTAAEETAAEEKGGGVGDGSAAAALIAFIRRCLPSRRHRALSQKTMLSKRPIDLVKSIILVCRWLTNTRHLTTLKLQQCAFKGCLSKSGPTTREPTWDQLRPPTYM